MESAAKILYTPEEQARQKIRNFVNEGLKDVQENALSGFEDVFDELESSYPTLEKYSTLYSKMI